MNINILLKLIYLFPLFILISVILEIVDFVINKYYLNNFTFPFLEILTVIGTIGSTIIALSLPFIIKFIENNERLNRLRGGLKSELLLNFDQISYYSINEREFKIDKKQYEEMSNNMHMVNPDAESIYRKLTLFYFSAQRFNELIEKMHGDNCYEWDKLKRDSIKLLLLIFWIVGKIDFEKEGEESMRLINDFDPDKEENLKNFCINLKQSNFWKLKDYETDVGEFIGIKLRIDKLEEYFLKGTPRDKKIIRRTYYEFLIKRLNSIMSEEETKLKYKLDNELRAIINF